MRKDEDSNALKDEAEESDLWRTLKAQSNVASVSRVGSVVFGVGMMITAADINHFKLDGPVIFLHWLVVIAALTYLMRNVEVVKQERREIKDSTTALAAERKTLETEKAALEASRAELKSTFDAKDESMRAELESKLESKDQSTRTQLESRDQDIKRLEAEKEGRSKKLESTETEKTDSDRKVLTLTVSLERMERDIHRLEEDLRKSTEARVAEVAHLTSEKEGLSSELRTMGTREGLLQGQIAGQKQTDQVVGEARIQLETQLAELRLLNGGLQEQVRKLEAKIESLTASLDETCQEKEGVSLRLVKSEGERKALQEKAQELQRQLAVTEERLHRRSDRDEARLDEHADREREETRGMLTGIAVGVGQVRERVDMNGAEAAAGLSRIGRNTAQMAVAGNRMASDLGKLTDDVGSLAEGVQSLRQMAQRLCGGVSWSAQSSATNPDRVIHEMTNFKGSDTTKEQKEAHVQRVVGKALLDDVTCAGPLFIRISEEFETGGLLAPFLTSQPEGVFGFFGQPVLISSDEFIESVLESFFRPALERQLPALTDGTACMEEQEREEAERRSFRAC